METTQRISSVANSNNYNNSSQLTRKIPPSVDTFTAQSVVSSDNSKNVKTPKTTKSIVKSRKRTSLDEFAHRIHLRPEIKAGFKAWLKGTYFAFDNEWEQLYYDYTNRKI